MHLRASTLLPTGKPSGITLLPTHERSAIAPPASFVLASTLAALLMHCGGSSAATATSVSRPSPFGAHAIASEADCADHERWFSVLSDGPDREALRGQILDFLASPESIARVVRADHNARASSLARIAKLYSPAEWSRGGVDSRIRPLARATYERAQARHDEGTMLAAAWAICASSPGGCVSQSAEAEEYASLARSSEDVLTAQVGASNTLVALERRVRVWERHVALVPTTTALQQLGRFYGALRETLTTAFAVLSMDPQRAAHHYRTAAINGAGAFLAHRDLAGAAEYLRGLNRLGAGERALITLFDQLLELPPEGWANEVAAEILTLANAYKGLERIAAAKGVCALGYERARDRAPFAKCLAELALEEPHAAGAVSFWYGLALEDETDSQDLHRSAIEIFHKALTEHAQANDRDGVRALVATSDRVLTDWLARYQDAATDPPAPAVYFAMGTASAAIGDPEAADRFLRLSAQREESCDAYAQLAELHVMLVHPAQAQSALAIARRICQEPGMAAHIIELSRMLAFYSEDRGAATDANTSLRAFIGEAAGAEDSEGSMSTLLSLFAAYRAGEIETTRNALRDLIDSFAEDSFRVSQVLVFLASEGSALDPEAPELAAEILRRAMVIRSIDRERQAYFALWAAATARLGGKPISAEVLSVVQARSHDTEWWGTICKRVVNEIDRAVFFTIAGDVAAQRIEASFYEGVFFATDSERTQLFEAALSTKMTTFMEYAMAITLVHSSRTTPAATVSDATQIRE